MRQLDHPIIELPSLDTPCCVAVQWKYNAEERTTIFHVRQTLKFGRESIADICLRVEPVELNEHKEATLKISRRHFRLSVDGDNVQIVDLDSTWGTSIGSTKLEPNKPYALQGGETVTVADAIRLNVRIEKENDRLQAVCLRRVNNRPCMEYICLIGQGAIDIGENALLQLPLASVRQGGSIPIIDIGQHRVVEPPAVVLVVDGGIHIKRTGSDVVTVNQIELFAGHSVAFPSEGIIRVGNTSFTITTQ